MKKKPVKSKGSKPISKSIKKPVTIAGVIMVTGLVLGFIALVQTNLPKLVLSAETPTTSIDPLATIFTFSNDGGMTLHDLKFSFNIDANIGTNVFKNITIENRAYDIGSLAPGHTGSASADCSASGYEINATMTVKVNYKLLFMPLHTSFKYVVANSSDGYTWLEK